MEGDNGESLIGRVGPGKLLRQLLSAKFLRHEKPRWVQEIATLPVPDGRVLVFDPVCYDVRNPEPHHALDVTLEGPPGQAAIHLQFRGPRVSAVEIRWSEDSEDSREIAGEVGVDSATLAIAPASNLVHRWMIGGTRNRSAVLVSYSLDDTERAAVKERAAAVLRAEGFPVFDDGKEVRFRFPLEDADIEHGNRALTAAAVPAEVWAEPHSCVLIEEGIEQKGFAVLEDGGVPYLVGFTSGWGDGTYVWHSLKKAGNIIGFSCVLIDPDE